MAARLKIHSDNHLARIAAWRSRIAGQRYGAVEGPGGTVAVFALDRLIAPAEHMEGIADQADPDLTYRLLPDLPPPEGVEASRQRDWASAPGVAIIEFDGASVPIDALDDEAPTDGIVDSRAGAGTLAKAAELQAQGIRATPDWIGEPAVLPATSSMELPIGPSADAYTWDEFAGPASFVRAWQLIEAHRLLGGALTPIQIGILDSGFWFDRTTGNCLGSPQEFPGPIQQLDLVDGSPRAGGQALVPPAPWHGQATASIAVGPHNNAAGTAGAGGSVATPFLFRTGLAASEVIQGVRTATAWGVDVLNMSFSIKPGSFLGFDDFPDDAFDSAFQWAHDNGVVIVAAAGNDGARLPDLDVRPATRTPGVIAVGGLAKSRSKMAWSGSNYGQSVDIWAAGEAIHFGADPTAPGGGLADGTSGAAPLVAGAAAMIKAVNPALSADQVFQIMSETGWRDSPDGKVTLGLDAGAAVWRAMGDRFVADLSEPDDGAARPLLHDAATNTWVPSVGRPRALSAWGDKDRYWFDVREFSRLSVVLSAFAPLGTAKVILTSQDPENASLETMEETVSGGRRELLVRTAPPGRYEVLVMSGQTVYDLAVTVTATGLEPDEWEPNNTLETASRFSLSAELTLDLLGGFVSPQGTYQFTLHRADDVDVLHVADVRPPSGNQRALVLVGNADHPVTVEVLKRDGTVLRRTTAHHNAETLRLEPPACYVRVLGSRPTRYSLTLTYQVDLTELVIPLKIPVDVLPPWELSSPLTLHGFATHYLFEVESGSAVTGLELAGSAGLTAQVLGGDGEPVVTGTPSTAGVRIDTSGLPAGNHVLRVGRAMAEGADVVRQPPLDFKVIPVLSP